MDLSLRLILDEMGLEADIYLPDGSNPKFGSVEIYDGGETYPDRLYICLLSEAIAAGEKGRAYFLCAGDAESIAAVADKSELSGITIVRGGFEVTWLFNRVSRLFSYLAKWIVDMERNVSRRAGLQSLMQLAEPVFGNFITVQDSTFRLVARTTGVEPPSPVMSRLVQLGYHPPESMELFRQHRRIEQFTTITDVIISRDRVTSEFDIVKKAFHLGGALHMLVVMDCCWKPANSAVVELFGILLEYIEFYTGLDATQTGSIGGVEALVLDILDKNAGSEDKARSRAKQFGYPFDGVFRLFVFSFEDDSNVPLAHHVQLLTRACGDVVAFSRERYILLLENRRTVGVADIRETAENEIGHTGFKCGISNDFHCLWDIPPAYRQALVALSVSSALKPSAPGGQKTRFHLFSDILVHHIVSAGYNAAPEAFKNSFIFTSIVKLREYDARHHTGTMGILRLFLENELNAKATAVALGLHRNTVQYHIGKICDHLGISLDDPDTRLQLLLALKAAELEWS